MSNPCECCQSKLRFITQINGNFMHSMVIPECFVKYFGGKIPGTVKLEAANGNIYDVGVTESMNRKILKSGWAAFVDANKIEENYSLIFRYLGNDCFKITIFDSNGMEKALCRAGMKTAYDVTKPSNNHIVDNSSGSRDFTTRSSSGEGSDSDGRRKEKSCHYCESEKTDALSNTSEEFSEDNPSADELLQLQMLSKNYVISGRCDLTLEQEAKIHALVTETQSKVPVLVVQLKKTNVEPSNVLVIRKKYALAYFPRERQIITLKVPSESMDWHCNLRIRRDGGCNLGWGNFVRGNSVREGDICIFQPMTKVKARRYTVMVHLLHKESIGHSPGGRINTGSICRRTSTNIASPARVKEEPATDGIAEPSPARVKEEPATDGEDISPSGYEDHGASDNSEGASETPFVLPTRARLTQAQEKIVLEKVNDIQSDLPIYVAVMNKTSVGRRGDCLSIGMRYVSRYLMKYATGHHEKRSVISLVLQREGKSRTWVTELRCRRYRTTIGRGWVSFARINNLREDDICLFKLLENEERPKMMVYIIRRHEVLA